MSKALTRSNPKPFARAVAPKAAGLSGERERRCRPRPMSASLLTGGPSFLLHAHMTG